jgi:glyoxylase-like metal-dependent hydrolase (beta-lactamase superfamily II)
MNGRETRWGGARAALVAFCIALGCGRGGDVTYVGAEGFYRLVRDGDTWWFVDPDGRRFVSIGINHIEPVLIVADGNREAFRARYGDDLVGPGGFGDPNGKAAAGWLADSMKLVRSWGFNTLGVHNPIPQHEMPHVAKFRPAAIDGWAGLEREYMDPFDPSTRDHVETEARAWCRENAGDRSILGVSFNDMPVMGSNPRSIHPWVAHIMGLGRDAPGKKRWVELLEQRYGEVAGAADVYAVRAGSWDEFLGTTVWPTPMRPWKAMQDADAFLALVVDEWYGLVTSSLRACDPNHLVFGDKFDAAGDMPPWLDPLIGKHFDLAFIQWYEYADRQIPRLAELHGVTGEPVLMGDSSFSAPNENIPNPKGVHLGSQEEVGLVYAEYLESVMAQPYVVGWHHCGFIEGSPDLERFHPYFAIQPGLLRPDGTPYEDTVARVTEANRRAFSWHASPTVDGLNAASPLFRSMKGYERCTTGNHAYYSLTRVDSNVFNVGGVPGVGRVPSKNVSWVVTDEGVVVIDTGLPRNGRIAKALIRSVTGKPVRTIIYTHHHGTQLAGAQEIRDPGTEIVAHEDLVLELDLERDLAPYNQRRNMIQFDMPFPPPAPEYVYPDVTYKSEYAFTLGGTRFELHHVEGEAEDYSIVWMPEQRIAWVADLLGPSVPLVGSPMKRVRDEVKWRKALEFVKGLGPEVLVLSVGVPVCSAFQIDARLDTHIAYLRFIHDAVVRELNAGSSLEEALARIEVPKRLMIGPNLHEDYGSDAFNIRGLYHRYQGWFDRNGTSLVAAPARDRAASFVAAMGGRARVLALARDLDDDGEASLCLEYLDLLIALDDDDVDAHALKGEILERMSGQPGIQPIMRSMLGSLARLEKLKAGIPVDGTVPGPAGTGSGGEEPIAD